MNNIYIKRYDHDDYLIHHGIKGQKWGRRRYQNADGSLTIAGRARYGVIETESGSYKISKRQMDKANKRAASNNGEVYFKTAGIGNRKLKVVSKKESRKLQEKAASDPMNYSMEDLKNKTAHNNAVADYMNSRARVAQYSNGDTKSKTDKILSSLDTAAKAANSISSIYNSYNKVFGNNKQTEMEKINLANARVNLENSNLNRRRTELMIQKLQHDYNKSLADEAWQNRINQAKKSTIFRSQFMSDETLKSWTQRKKTENEFLDAMFSQYDRVKK